MALLAVPFEPSYTALRNLRQKIHKHTTTSVNLTLPNRPQDLFTDSNPYLDGAIGMLSDSTAFLYDDDAPWAIRVAEVKRGVDRVDAKVDEVKTQVDEVKTQVDEVKTQVDEVKTQVDEVKTQVDEVRTQVAEVKTQMKSMDERLTAQVDDVRASLRNHTAIQLNSLRKWLGDSMEPVSAPVQVNGSWKYTVGEGFPERVKDFWKLTLHPTVLIKLARHYSVQGWDRWKRATSRDTDVTCYMELEDAVTAHPYKCLMQLAMKWGLQYSALERPRTPLQRQGLGKRKAETDNGSRRVRAREDHGSDSTTGSESTSSQDVDDQGSQASRVISVQMRVPAHTEGRYGDLIERMIAAADRPERQRDPPEDPYGGYVLGWRIESSTTTERRRNRMRHSNGRSVHTSELQGRH
jgi:hypothetical protein